MNEEIKKKFDKYSGNSMVIGDFHFLLSEKEFTKAKKYIIDELGVEKKDAKILIDYYKKEYTKKLN